MILDAGVLVAIDRNEPAAKDFVNAALEDRAHLRTTAPVVAQVWRDGARQVRLVRFLRWVEVLAFRPEQAPLVGSLLRRSQASDVVDAHVLACALDLPDSIITADIGDFAQLSAHLGAGSPKLLHWRR